MGKIIDNYSLQSQLGSGVYSKVYKAVNLKTKEVVAIKMVKIQKFKELPKLQEGTINEINILSNLDSCKHIIKYYDMLKTSKNFYFVYQFCNGGTLEELLKKVHHFEQHQALSYFRQIIDGFRVLNKHHIMHRDLKPQNILLNDGVIKIADFGFCKVLENPNEMAQTMLGSPIYMAPQILKGQNYTIKADIWSIGVILFRCLFGYCPFQSASIAKLIVRIEHDDLNFPPEPKVSPVVIQLLMRMLVKDPSKRADWSEIFSFQISEEGQIKKQAKDDFFVVKNSFTNTKASTTGSSDQGRTSTCKNQPFVLPRSNTDSNKQLPLLSTMKVKSKPSANENLKQWGAPTRNSRVDESKSINKREDERSVSKSNAQAHSSSYIRSKTPTKDRVGVSRAQNFSKNHSKFIQLVSICHQVAKCELQSGFALAYLIAKEITKEQMNILEVIKKQCSKDYENIPSQQVYGLIIEELDYLRMISEMLESEITVWSLGSLEGNRKALLKEFINSLKLDTINQLVMVSRVIDYIEEALLIRKETYERLSKQQLVRQIKNRSSSW